MTQPTATIIAALLTATASIVGAITTIIVKYDLALVFRRAPFDLSGNWQGCSAYLAGEMYDPKTEALWTVKAKITQHGRRLFLEETLIQSFDISKRSLPNVPERTYAGRGRIANDEDVVITLREKNIRTHGVMFLLFSKDYDKLEGMIVLRNPMLRKPVAVKILLRKENALAVSFDELGIEFMAAAAHKQTNEDRDERTPPHDFVT